MSNFMLLRTAGNVGDQVGDVGRVVVVGALEGLFGDVFQSLKPCFSVMHQTMRRSPSITASASAKVARHLDPGTFDLADPLAEVATLRESETFFGPRLAFHKFLAFEFEQFGGIAFFHLGAELLEFRVGILGLRRDGHGPGNSQGRRQHDASLHRLSSWIGVTGLGAG
jgi:hypothetical protein